MASKILKQINDLASRYGTDDGLPNAKLPFLYVAFFESTAPPLPHLTKPTISIITQGTKQIILGKKTLEYKAGEAFINSVDLPLTIHMSKVSQKKPLLSIGIALSPAIISSLIIDLDSKKYPSTVSGAKIAVASEELLDAVFRLLKLLDQPEDIPILGEALEREIHWRILKSDLGTIAAQLSQSGNHTIQITKAIKWIQKNYNKTLKVAHLAKLSAMSSTSFHRHFRLITSMSPVQYQKKIRLQEARIRLMSSNDDVASVGFAVGYESPSQFSREYCREFGVPPKRDSKFYGPS